MDTEKTTKAIILIIALAALLIGMSFNVGTSETPNKRAKTQQTTELSSPKAEPVIAEKEPAKKEVGSLFAKRQSAQIRGTEKGFEEELTSQQEKLKALGFDPFAKHSVLTKK